MIYENNTAYLINLMLNSFLHVTLLFSFLSILFYYIVSPLTQTFFRQTISDLIDNIINKNIPNKITLSKLDISQMINNYNLIQSELSKIKPSIEINNKNNDLIKSELSNIQPSSIEINDQNNINFIKLLDHTLNNPSIINNLIQQYSTTDDIINMNNESIISYSIIISFFLLILTSLLIITFKILFPDYINVSEILIENIITFTFVGIIEYWFFTNYAFKYVPESTSDMLKLSIKNIKTLLLIPYVYTNTNDPTNIINTRIVFS